jgi:hypothetical protein
MISLVKMPQTPREEGRLGLRLEERYEFCAYFRRNAFKSSNMLAHAFAIELCQQALSLAYTTLDVINSKFSPYQPHFF